MVEVKKGQTVYTPGRIYREGEQVPDELLRDPPKPPVKAPGKDGKTGK